MAKKELFNDRVKELADAISFIDSSTHRLRPSRGRVFHLKKGKETVPVYVTVEEARPNGNSLSTLSRKNGRYELRIPIQRGKASRLSLPVKIQFNEKEYLLNASASPSRFLPGSQRVSLSLYSEDEQ